MSQVVAEKSFTDKKFTDKQTNKEIDTITEKGDFKNNASISLINVYRLSKADLLLKLILRYVINVFLASCQVSSL